MFTLKEYEMKQIIKRFPTFELPYEKIIHKKVSSDYCLAIPYGDKFFAWFSYYKHYNVCYFLQITKNRSISNIFYSPCCFHKDLSYNTIMYGTLEKNKRFFFIEDIFYFKNKNVSMYNNKKKLLLIKNLFENYISQISVTKNDIIFGLPIMKPNFNELYAEIQNLPYNCYCIQFRSFTNDKMRFNYIHSTKPQKLAIFKIKAEIYDDIYNLYYYSNGDYIKHTNALIPSYKCSIMMNSLFRNIKENVNLDALEESDDEETFENINSDKFVDLEKYYFMECEYSHKFKKWIPLKISKHHKTIHQKDLFFIEKK